MGSIREKILITGAAGYIAGHLIEFLQNVDYDLYCVDKMSMDHLQSENCFIVNISDRSAMFSILDEVQPDVIIDLAALTIVNNDLDISDYSINFIFPEILEEYYKEKSQAPRVIFTSTQYVIGPESNPESKLSYSPHTTYGESKVLYENNIQRARAVLKDFFIIRPTNVWGGRHPKYSTVWEPLLRRGLVCIPRVNPRKSYCHISTIVELIVSAINSNTKIDSFEDQIVYASDAPISQSQWVKLQCDAFKEIGINARFWQVPLISLYTISYILKVLSSLRIIKTNPLPKSRIVSMQGNYIVDLNRPSSFPHPKCIDDVYHECVKDLKERYDAK